MKVLSRCLIVAALAVVGSQAFAQDPGFRLPQDSRQPAATTVAPGPSVMGAGTLNSMDSLDNSTPIQPMDQCSFRIVEDRGNAIPMTVTLNGEIIVPNVGVVQAAGLTCRQLAMKIKSQLEASIYKTATVILTIDYRPPSRSGGGYNGTTIGLQFFTVYGQVLRQGKYEIPSDEDITISQAVLRAGGFAQFANPKKVRLVRSTPQGRKTILVNLDDVMRRGNLGKDVYIRDGDVIIIDEKNVNF
ncbi:MAG: polysaccharide biosynthesis/export family protein [Verrucomicrobiales bacterium]|nr:polysaccharide biosynthesis/export family protein [Verrucomicrobiales bacterium]MCP5558071.1 polysaccharide biosynthesis/export family protein [Verrucomicrobiaceae bacterium]